MTIKNFIVVLLLSLLVAAPSFADSDKNCAVVSEAINPTEARATDDYINLTDGTFSTVSTDEDEFSVPTQMVARKLRASVSPAPGAGDTWDVILVVDDTEVALACQIAGTATKCSNLESKVALSPGSKLAVFVTSGVGATDPTATSELLVSFCLSEL